MSEFNIKYMEKALELAREAFQDDEVPVGAVIVRNGEIVATGRNRREKEKNALLHAETDAINNACKVLGGWRLWNCDIYVTLEPCPMCAGAIINAHIPNVYFGAYDFKNGSCGTITNLLKCRIISSRIIKAVLCRKSAPNFSKVFQAIEIILFGKYNNKSKTDKRFSAYRFFRFLVKRF